MQQVVKRRIVLCRMVRDNCNKVVVQSPKQSHAAEPQSPSEPSEEHREQSPNRAESRERQLDLLHWVKNNYEEDAELWVSVHDHSLLILLMLFFVIDCLNLKSTQQAEYHILCLYRLFDH